MAVSIDWATTKVISVPRADMAIIQVSPEVRELDIDAFRLELKDLEASVDGMPWTDTHRHNTIVTIAGLTLARVVEILAPYTITFEVGAYAVNLTGANSNILDVVNFNTSGPSIRANNSAGLIELPELVDLHQFRGLDKVHPLTITDSQQTVAGKVVDVTDDGTTTTVDRTT